MATQQFTVEVQPDFIERQAKARPIDALAEIIWNGLDADATTVDVRLGHGEFGLSSITVTDNGHGIPHAEASTLFTRLGGSWKQRGGFTKTKHRMLHGYEGRGRFKVFALGRAVDWHVNYRPDESKALSTYDITMLESSIREVRISDENLSADGARTGVEVKVSELHRDFRSLEPDTSVQELSEIFALYLKDYRDAKIAIEGVVCGHCATAQKLKDGTERINRCNAGPFCGRWFLHKFRHTYATRHLQDGVDIRTLQQWMGHRDIASTMVYLKGVRNSDIQARINKGSLAAFA
jgi:hypothetical protein